MSENSDRLAQTRLAIIAHLHERRAGRKESTEQVKEKARMAVTPGASGFGSGPGRGRLAGFAEVGRNWWMHHPASTVVELATPLLSHFAGRKPLAYLGVSAALGALFFLARPWKLISVTGIVVALLKSSQLSSIIQSAVSAATYTSDDERPDEPVRTSTHHDLRQL